MKNFFLELFEHNHICNQKLGTIFLSHSAEVSEKASKLYNHILNVHQIWNCRIELNQTPFKSGWEIHLLEEYSRIDKMNYDNSLLILDKHDLNASINYLSAKGEPFVNSVRDILFHIINHSTYHRGQIAADLRSSGLEPVATDYILFKR